MEKGKIGFGVEVQEIMMACHDTRNVSEDVARRLTENPWGASYNVGKIAWPLLGQTWRMAPETWSSVIAFLKNEQAVTCAAAARLLRQRKDIPEAQRREALMQIRTILADDTLSRRPLRAPSGVILRLDDELYDTLRVLAA